MHEDDEMLIYAPPKRSIAWHWNEQFLQTYAFDDEERGRAEAQPINDELHCRGEIVFTDQIMLKSEDFVWGGPSYCLHLFPDGSAFGCGCGKGEMNWRDVRAIAGDAATVGAAGA
jgi:hypothetical protein